MPGPIAPPVFGSSHKENSVADEESKSDGTFDVNTVRVLVGLMSRHDLAEIDLRRGDRRIRLRRGGGKTKVATMPPIAAPVAALPAAAAPAAPVAAAKKFVEIKSPTPGTFYSRPSPEAPPFVKVGSRVDGKTVVCLVEAMKLYTEIQAECTGVITEMLVENAQPVEFDQVLFRVDPTA
jgi:acetyl-CoA carboxylase biotin carboxyl carrier protein